MIIKRLPSPIDELVEGRPAPKRQKYGLPESTPEYSEELCLSHLNAQQESSPCGNTNFAEKTGSPIEHRDLLQESSHALSALTSDSCSEVVEGLGTTPLSQPEKDMPLLHLQWPTTNSHHVHRSCKDMQLKPFKTFFSLEDMIKARVAMFSDSEHVVFEFFARVWDSRCDSSGHQHFLFKDIFNPSSPCINGTLSAWGADLVTDHMLETILGSQKEDTCYCQCRLAPDAYSYMGWSVIVIEIAKISIFNVVRVKDRMGRGDVVGLQFNGAKGRCELLF